MAVPSSPPTAPRGHLSCYDASSTGEESEAWRSQAPHPGHALGHSLTATGSRALNPSGASASSYTTLSRCFLLFLIFVVTSVNSSVFAGEARMEQQQKSNP